MSSPYVSWRRRRSHDDTLPSRPNAPWLLQQRVFYQHQRFWDHRQLPTACVRDPGADPVDARAVSIHRPARYEQWRISDRTRRDLEQRGINEAAPNRVWSITDLAVVGKHTKARKIKQYIALYDTVVLIRYQEELWAVYVDLGVLTCLAGTTARIFNLRSVMDDIAGVIQKETSRAGTLPACVPVWRRSVVRDFGPPGTASRLRDRFFRQ